MSSNFKRLRDYQRRTASSQSLPIILSVSVPRKDFPRIRVPFTAADRPFFGYNSETLGQMCILVTGATGLVGNNVVRMLVERGAQVRVFMREAADSRPLRDLSVEIARGDVRDAKAAQQAVDGARLIIHAAAVVKLGRRNHETLREINVEGTRTIARLARVAGIRLLHVSSTDAIGIKSISEPADEDTLFDVDTQAPYILSKVEAERLVLDEVDRGLDAVIANPSFMLGPWDWKPSSGQMLLEVARGRGWLAPHGYYSVADVRDVSHGILAAAEHGRVGRRYILSGETMSYLDSWRLFADVVGVRQPWGYAPRSAAWIGGRLGDLWGMMTGAEPNVNSVAVAVTDLERNYSCARAEAELGYHRRPVRETVRDTWEWFQQHGYA